MRIAGFLGIALSAAGVVWGQGVGFPGDDGPPVRLELLTEGQELKAGEEVEVGLRFQIAPAWHLYWKNPGSPGFAPRVSWELPDGFEAGPLRFPTPKSFYAAGFKGYGYEGEVVFLTRIAVPADWAGGSAVPIGAKANWLMCDPETCVPGNQAVQGELGTGGEGSRDWLEAARRALPVPVDWPVRAVADREPGMLVLEVEDGGALDPVEGVEFFLGQMGVGDATRDETVRRAGEILEIVVPLKANVDLAALPEGLGGVLVSKEGFAGFEGRKGLAIGDEASGSGEAEAEGLETGVGGDAEQGGEGWGYWLQRPLLVMLLAGLMMAIGLNLFGVFEIGTGLTGVGGNLTQKEGLTGSFFSGALATVLATPCTAPFMGSAIAYALGQPAAVTLLVFTSLGLGMASPYLILSCYPVFVKRLPRPGAWMETFKQAMGFPMLLVVTWLVWVVAHQVTENGLLYLLAGLVVLGLACWIYGRFDRPGRLESTRWVTRGVCAALLVGLVAGWMEGAKLKEPVEDQAVEARILALQEEGKSVFVDFTAAWCLTCQANKAAMHAGAVEAAFEARGVAFLEVDWTKRDPAILRVLQKYGREGVPLYLLFPPEPGAAPAVLPNLLTEQIILAALDDKTAAPLEDPQGLGFFAALAGAFLGGIILNLMPCVFPVISLKIMGFVNQAGENRAKIRNHGFAFALGALSFFWLLAIALLAARSGLS